MLLIWPPVRINLVDSLIGCLYLFVIRDPPHWWSQLVIFFKKPPRDTSHGICKIDTSSKISSSGGVNLVSKGSPGSGKRYYESIMVIRVVFKGRIHDFDTFWQLATKGQLISEEFFLVFTNSNKPMKYFTDFCPSL